MLPIGRPGGYVHGRTGPCQFSRTALTDAAARTSHNRDLAGERTYRVLCRRVGGGAPACHLPGKVRVHPNLALTSATEAMGRPAAWAHWAARSTSRGLGASAKAVGVSPFPIRAPPPRSSAARDNSS